MGEDPTMYSAMDYHAQLSSPLSRPLTYLIATFAVFLFFTDRVPAQDNSDSGMKAHSAISEVTVYRDRASVEREAIVDLPAGTTDVIFPHLPEGVIDDTVRVKSGGERDFTILGVEVQRRYLVKSRQKRIQEIEQRIEKLRSEDSGLVDRMNASGTIIRFLESIGDFSTMKAREGILYRGINLTEISDAISYVEKSILKEREKIRNVIDKRRDISDSIRVLEKKLNDIAGSGYMSHRQSFYNNRSTMISRATAQDINQYNSDVMMMDNELSTRRQEDREKWAIVTIRAAKAGKYAVKLNYVITGAQWTPLYDVRAELKEGKIEMTYYGMVKQKTGEDWDSVRMYLSTADPRRATDPPTLPPWLVAKRTSFRSIEEEIGRRIEGAAGAADYASTGIAVRKEMAAEMARQKTLEKGTSVTYRVSSPKSVPSGVDAKKIPVDVISFTGKSSSLTYVLVPDKSTFAYLRTTITNSSPYTILPGKTNLYLDGDFAGAANISSTVSPGKKFTLHFGTDDAIKTTKILIKKFTEERGLFGGEVRTSYHYRIKIENGRKKESKFLLIDRIPFSQQKEITVGMDSVEPAPISGDREEKRPAYNSGQRRWKLTVPALSSRSIDIKFHVQHPKDIMLRGVE